MSNNKKTYSYTLQLDAIDGIATKEKVGAIADALDGCETKTRKTHFRPAILTGVKNVDLLSLSLDRQIAGMLDWGKAAGGIIPLLGKVRTEIEKMQYSL